MHYNEFMTPPKPKGDKRMERIFNMRVSNDFMTALEEAKWTLRKNVTDIVKEAILEYLEQHLPEEAKKKVKEILKKTGKEKTQKGGK